jgi:hypothetical protein
MFNIFIKVHLLTLRGNLRQLIPPQTNLIKSFRTILFRICVNTQEPCTRKGTSPDIS